jgi:TonB family protein
MSVFRLQAAVALALLLPSHALSATEAAPPAPPADGGWLKKPSTEQISAVYPKDTQSARAVARCQVTGEGLLSDCRAISEQPQGSGIAQRLIALAPFFQVRPDQVKAVAPEGYRYIIASHATLDTKPDWLRRPSPEELVSVWPKAAWKRRLGGRAQLNCWVSVQGVLVDCVVTSEFPAGEHFGDAALAMAPQMLMKAGSQKGQLFGSGVNVPVNFPKEALTQFGDVVGDASRNTALPISLAWAQSPSYSDIAAVYPKKALAGNISGRAIVDCNLKTSGTVEGCTVSNEQPRGQGFGAAAIKLAQMFRAPEDLQGSALRNASILLPFTFDPAVLGDQKPPIGHPRWIALPTSVQTIEAFTPVAKAGVTGTIRVTLSCTVQRGGGVSDCSVAHEEPAGQGVGQAALTLTPYFKVSTWTAEGLPTVGGGLNIPLRYEGGSAEPIAKTEP